MAQIIDSLIDFNPWWKGTYEIAFKEREVYQRIQKFMPLRQILALTGLRRVGKTTLLLKLVADLVEKGFSARQILYFTFDEFREIEIRELMRSYEEMMGGDFRKTRHVLLLDEIQKLEEWEAQLKVIYDSFPKLKVLISGSESLFIKRKSRETMAGRIFEFKVEPLSFREFLSFKGAAHEPVELYRKELRRLFDEFVLTEGFPELVDIQDRAVIKKYIRESIVERVIYKDISQLFKIKDNSVLESLINILMEEPGQIIDLTDLAKELGVARQTLSNYLGYLEESFLVRKLYNFSRSRRKVERMLKKYYPTIMSPDLLFTNDPVKKSKAFECLIVGQLGAEYFWRDPYKNEVDIVQHKGDLVPVEVKFGKIETQGLLAFMKKFKVVKGIVISPDQERTEKRNDRIIRTVPAYKYLLEASNSKEEL